MIEREKLIRYCRLELDEGEIREVEAAIEADANVRALYREVALDTLWQDVAGDTDEPELEESAADLAARREFIARQLDDSRRSEWWSLVPDDTRDFAELRTGEALPARVRWLRPEVNEYGDTPEFVEQAFGVEVRRLSDGRYRLTSNEWPAGYRVRSLRLGKFDLPEFPTLVAGKLPEDELVEPARSSERETETQRDSLVEVLRGSSGREPGELAAAEHERRITSAEATGIEMVLDRERLTIRLEGVEPPVVAVAELVRHSQARGRLPVQRRAVRLEPRNRLRIGIDDTFDYPAHLREQEVRVTVRPLEADDLYLLQKDRHARAPLKTHLDSLLAEQPASSAPVEPCAGGYEAELWTEQFELARDPATCWALQVVPT